MKRAREYHFRYTEYLVTDAGDIGKREIPVAVTSYDQPKAEAKADAEFREFVHGGKRLNWARLRRDLIQVA